MPDLSEDVAMPRILIVGDEMQWGEELARSLRNLGYEIAGRVASAEEALRLVEESKPDLILMDGNFKLRMYGIEANDRIRALFSVPVVYHTAFTGTDFLEKAARSRPDSYSDSSAALLELRSSIEKALFKHESESESEKAKICIIRYWRPSLKALSSRTINTSFIRTIRQQSVY